MLLRPDDHSPYLGKFPSVLEKAGCKMYHLLYFLHAGRQSVFMQSPPLLVPFCCCGASVPSTSVIFSNLAASVPEKMIPGENPKHEMNGLCGTLQQLAKVLQGSPMKKPRRPQIAPDVSRWPQMAPRRFHKAPEGSRQRKMASNSSRWTQKTPDGSRGPQDANRKLQMAPEGARRLCMAPGNPGRLQKAPHGPRWPQMTPESSRMSQMAPRGPNGPRRPRWPQRTPNGTRWTQMAPEGTKRLQESPEAIEYNVKYEVFDTRDF